MTIKDDRILSTVESSYTKLLKHRNQPLDREIFVEMTGSTHCETELMTSRFARRSDTKGSTVALRRLRCSVVTQKHESWNDISSLPSRLRHGIFLTTSVTTVYRGFAPNPIYRFYQGSALEPHYSLRRLRCLRLAHRAHSALRS